MGYGHFDLTASFFNKIVYSLDRFIVRAYMLLHGRRRRERVAAMNLRMPPGNAIQHLLARLASAGFSRSYVKKYVFPSWWKPELATDQAGYARAIGFVHNHLGIPVDVLWNHRAKITCPANGNVLYKKAARVSLEDLGTARCIAIALAELAVAAMPAADVKLTKKPAQIRKEILAAGHDCVDLENLLDYLWASGIPVIHIDEFPQRKMAGLAVMRQGRPAIILSKNHRYKSLMVFDLAHECGHILSGHLGDNDIVLDVEIRRDGETDPREIEATEKAIALLTGRSDTEYRYEGDESFPIEWAEECGKRDKVSPGVVAQNAGHVLGNFQMANGICRVLERDVNPIALVRQKMFDNLSFEDLSADDIEFLIRAAGGGTQNEVSSGH